MQLELTGEPVAQFYRHCDDCQTMHGSAYVPESVHPAANVKVLRGNPSSWQLKRNPRVFCSMCGTRGLSHTWSKHPRQSRLESATFHFIPSF